MQADSEAQEFAQSDIALSETLLQGCPDGIALVAPSGWVIGANPAAAALLGLGGGGQEDFFGRLHADDREPVRKAFSDSKPGDTFTLDFRLCPDGGEIPVEARVRNALHAPRSSGFAVSLREAPPGREQLHARHRLLSLIVKKLPIMASRIDGQGIIRESFGGGLRSAGLGEGDAVGMNALEGWPAVRRHLERAYAGETVQFEFEEPSPARRVFDVRYFPDPSREGCILGFGIDITERKRAEEDLAKSEALNRRMIESSLDCIALLDTSGQILSISKNGRHLLELEDAGGLLLSPWLELWKGPERGRAELALRGALSRGIGKFQGQGMTAKGRPKWWDVMITPVLGADERPERLLVVARDITDTKDFEETLRRSRDQLEAILKGITDAVLVTDPNGWVVYANDAAARLLGRESGKDILGAALDSLAASFEIREEAGPAKGLLFPDVLRERAARGECRTVQGRVVRLGRQGGGPERWLVVNSSCIQDAKGTPVLYIDTAYDITDRKRAEDALRKSEEQLRQSQKMEAMGRLAGGVAHDFNNLLTAINGYGEILAHAMGEDDPLRANVEEIRRAGDRAAALTRQLLTFSRKQVLSRRVLDLNQSVAEIRSMLVRLIGEDIELLTVADPAPARVNVDPGQIEQVILNLALNSRDAMPMGGKLVIETANVVLDPRQSGIFYPVDSGSYVRLTVTDTGFGMGEEVKAHLFEPFFTTKPQGQGTGLGLCTVYGIVKQAGGTLSVWSEPGRGTSISAFLPSLEREPDPVPQARPEAAAPAARAPSQETILLAEDEELVRRLVFQLLRAQGYAVLAAGSGQEALDAAERHAGPIELLLTDVVMGGMSGRELAEKLLAVRPKTKVLYMSGYTDDATLRHGVYRNSAAFLGKPFSTSDLIRKIRDVLEMQESGKQAAGSAVASSADFTAPRAPV